MRPQPGQVAVVTGGGSGIGLALSNALAECGLDLVLADLDPAALGEAEARVATHGTRVTSKVVDVTDQNAVDRLAEYTLEQFGRVDIVVNNAGVIGKCLPIWEYECVEGEWIFGVNVLGVIHGIRSFVPHLVKQHSGHIVNTSSMAGLSVVPQLGPYTAAKHAVVSLSETLRADLDVRAPEVGVTVLCPGPTDTPLVLDGGRARPEHLLPSVDAGTKPGLDPLTMTVGGEKKPPAVVADATIDAMIRGCLYVAPHPIAGERLRQRIDRISTDVLGVTEVKEVDAE